MMRFGIPSIALPRVLLRAEIDRIRALGVTLHLNTPLTPEFGLRELRAAGFDAVFLSVGVSRGRDLQTPGVELDGVVKAIDYLLNVNRGYRLDLGRRVVVIGGGFVAFDAARTALAPRARPGSIAGRGAARGRSGCARERKPSTQRGPRARRRRRSDHRLARELRRDARSAHDAGTRGVRGGQREGIRFVPRRGPGASSATATSTASSCRRALGVRCRTAASRRRMTTATS